MGFSLFQQKVASKTSQEQEIIQRVAEAHVVLDEDEQLTANRIVAEVSVLFSEDLRTQSVNALTESITKAVEEKCGELELSLEDRKRIEKSVLTTVLGNGPIQVYMDDPDVTDIVVQRFDNIVIERNGITEKVEARFNSEEHLQTIIKRLVQKAGRQLNLMYPVVNAAMEDGSRINATIPPVSPDGATLTIRKFSNHALSGGDYIRLGSMDKPMLAFLMQCVKGKVSIFVSGGTGTGKTTLLNMLSSYIPAEELIITVEDTCELKLQQSNVRRMQVRPSTNHDMVDVNQQLLVKEALRQRPDRIILGETRDGTIVDLITAMSTGHEGSMSTIHANDPQNMCNVRIPILYGMNRECSFSEKTIGMQVSEAVELIIQIRRFADGSRKLTHISYPDGYDRNGRVFIKDIFRYDIAKEKFYYTGNYPEKLVEKIRNNGVPFKEQTIFGKAERDSE